MVNAPTIDQYIVSQDSLVRYLATKGLLQEYTEQLDPAEALIVMGTAVHIAGIASDEEAYNGVRQQAAEDSLASMEDTVAAAEAFGEVVSK